MSRTRLSRAARPAARLMAVVVLPTPPFWLAMAMTRLIWPDYVPRGTSPGPAKNSDLPVARNGDRQALFERESAGEIGLELVRFRGPGDERAAGTDQGAIRDPAFQSTHGTGRRRIERLAGEIFDPR